MKLKYSVKFYLEKRRDKQTSELITNNVPIFMFFSFDGKRLQYYTGYRIDTNQWNPAVKDFPGNVKRNNYNKDGISSTEINSHLTRLNFHTTEIYKKAKANDIFPSVDYIRSELKKRLDDPTEGKGAKFFDVFNQFVTTEGKKNTWTVGTYKKFHTLVKHLEAYQEKTKRKIDFNSMDEKWFSKWVDYLREDLGHRNSYVEKNLKIFKWFLRWSGRKGFNPVTDYQNYSPELKIIKSKITFLTWEELMTLYHLEIEPTYLQHVRDVFCLMCFTGLRHSDVYNLRRNMIKDDHIEITTIKTDDRLIIELNDYSRAIFKKYADVPFKDNKALPVISNQKMNEYLKKVGQLAGFNEKEVLTYFKGNERIEETVEKWQLLSTHVGRKTFITNALYLGIPSEVIMKWTGHRDHRTMENYIGIARRMQYEQMQKFNYTPGLMNIDTNKVQNNDNRNNNSESI